MSNGLELKSITQNVAVENIGARNVLGVLPRHFIESTLLRIGGKVIGVFDDDKIIGCGFSFPTFSGGCLKNVIRGHRLGSADFNLPDNWLDVGKFREDSFDGQLIMRNIDFDIANPNRRQAEEAMALQQKTWGKSAALYPYDLYKDGSGADTRLVALDKDDRTIGFLLGFIGAGNKWMGDKNGTEDNEIWVESQITAVEPNHQRKNVARALKWMQYKGAEERGIKLIHWTVDPLQAVNAGLNYGLGAVAAEFTPNYYSFRNDKNRVAASRFGVYWLVGSQRAEKAKADKLEQKSFLEFKVNLNTLVINPLSFTDLENWLPQSENILIEIPKNWDEVQKNQIDLAIQWRNTTDAIFEKIIGVGKGKYIITGRVFDGETPYLIAQRFEEVYM